MSIEDRNRIAQLEARVAALEAEAQRQKFKQEVERVEREERVRKRG